MMAALTSLFSPAFWRAKLAEREARAFDRRFGVDTVAQVPVAQMRDVEPALAAHAVHYEASAIPKFRRALRAIERRLGPALRDYEFVDVGSGKGLVVMLAALHGFRRIHGVEMSAQLHAVAESNVRAFARARGGAPPIELRCADAFRFALPQAPLVVYLYNPFDETFTERFVQKLLDEAGGDLLIAYVNPVHKRLFATNPRLRVLHDEAALAVYEAAERPVGAPA